MPAKRTASSQRCPEPEPEPELELPVAVHVLAFDDDFGEWAIASNLAEVPAKSGLYANSVCV